MNKDKKQTHENQGGVFMKTLRADHSYSDLSKERNYLLPGSQKKKAKADEFRTILEQTMDDQNEDWEEFRVLLPRHGNFWDNGYEDLE
jgi:hypothetical protein